MNAEFTRTSNVIYHSRSVYKLRSKTFIGGVDLEWKTGEVMVNESSDSESENLETSWNAAIYRWLLVRYGIVDVYFLILATSFFKTHALYSLCPNAVFI